MSFEICSTFRIFTPQLIYLKNTVSSVVIIAWIWDITCFQSEWPQKIAGIDRKRMWHRPSEFEDFPWWKAMFLVMIIRRMCAW